MVEVLRRYSKNAAALYELRRATERLGAPLAELAANQAPDDLASASPFQGAHRLSVRFSPKELDAMVERFQRGATLAEVARDFGVGLTTLKRLVRDRRSRRSDLGQGRPRRTRRRPSP